MALEHHIDVLAKRLNVYSLISPSRPDMALDLPRVQPQRLQDGFSYKICFEAQSQVQGLVLVRRSLA